jgi:hypothetical protein
LKGVSLNVLADQISQNYPEWHRYMKTFGTIVMSRDASVIQSTLGKECVSTVSENFLTVAFEI